MYHFSNVTSNAFEGLLHRQRPANTVFDCSLIVLMSFLLSSGSSCSLQEALASHNLNVHPIFGPQSGQGRDLERNLGAG